MATTSANITDSTDIPSVDLMDWFRGDAKRAEFVQTVGSALEEIGAFAVRNHCVDKHIKDMSYEKAGEFFGLPDSAKAQYERPESQGQRGFTSFGKEQAKGATAIDLKEFWQIGRTDVPESHAVHAIYGPNVWPAEVPGFRDTFVELFNRLELTSDVMLRACALYLNQPEHLFADMAKESSTLMRLIHYPPVGADAPAAAIRAQQHEDINLITLLVGSTAGGLEVLSHNGGWVPMAPHYDEIVIQNGDMLANLTNGLFKSTTHRVVNPDTERGKLEPRFSIPFFVHPKPTTRLDPLAECVARTGGVAAFPSWTARDYLTERLNEIYQTKKK
jgi:isopenicillin N synthase-like dioxygenase